MMMSQSSGRRGVAWAIIGGLVLLAGIVAIIISAVLARPTPTPSGTAPGSASPEPTASSGPDPEPSGAVVDPTAADRGWTPEPITTDADAYIRAALEAASTFDTKKSTREEWLDYLDTWFTPSRPGEPIDAMQLVGARLEAGVVAVPGGEEHRTGRLDLRRTTGERADGVRELRDLAAGVEGQPVPSESIEPLRIGARREFPLGVDDRLHLHRHSGVDVRPLAVLAEHLDVEPQMAVDVRIESARPAMLELDHLDPAEQLANAAACASARIQFCLPRREDAVAESILERLELCREVCVEHRRDAVRLRGVDRAVENQVCVGGCQIAPAALVRRGVTAVDPATKLLFVERVRVDGAVFDNEARDATAANRTVGGERLSAGGGSKVGIAGSLECVRERLSNPLRSDTPFPALQASAHGLSLATICITRY